MSQLKLEFQPAGTSCDTIAEQLWCLYMVLQCIRPHQGEKRVPEYGHRTEFVGIKIMFAIAMVLIDSDYNKSWGVEKTTLIIRNQTN